MSRIPRLKIFLAILGIFGLLSLTFSELTWARAGGGKSSSSAGSRSISPSAPNSRPATPPPLPSQSVQPARPVPPSSPPPRPQAPPQSSGFMRSMMGGLLGGFAGAMLFRGIAGAGGNGYGGSSGPGLMDLILIGAALYGLYYFLIKRRRKQQDQGGGSSMLGGLFGGSDDSQPAPPLPGNYAPPSPPSYGTDPTQGLSYIRSMDPGFNEQVFKDQVMDIFFLIQAAYSQRDVASVGGLLTAEMRDILGGGIDQLKAQGQINRLENIAVRTVELNQAWQEQGQDYLTVLITANLLDYTVDEKSGQVLAGSNTQPVKFQEVWTFTRPVGPGVWQLSAITQTN
ncbi:Tim44 domain-containing protein [Desulfarculales bacterium]